MPRADCDAALERVTNAETKLAEHEAEALDKEIERASPAGTPTRPGSRRCSATPPRTCRSTPAADGRPDSRYPRVRARAGGTDMAALATDRHTPYRDGELFSFPVKAGVKIYAGAIVVRSAGQKPRRRPRSGAEGSLRVLQYTEEENPFSGRCLRLKRHGGANPWSRAANGARRSPEAQPGTVHDIARNGGPCVHPERREAP